MGFLQTTIASPIRCKGIGVHSGVEVTLNILPAPENTGIVFKRTDIVENNIIPAKFDRVIDCRLCTVIANEYGVKISTVEHIMAALWGYFDNAIIEISGEEMPIMDGSSAPFVVMFEKAGVKFQNAPKKFLRVTKEIRIEDGDKFIELQPYDGFVVDYKINFQHKSIGEQAFKFDESKNSFNREISRARTFGFAHEIEQLRQIGLARGGSLSNAVGIDENGVMNPEGLRYQDEFVKHKLLDCIGDLYLAGYKIQGKVIASKAGHLMHNQVLRSLFANKDAYEIFEIPSCIRKAVAL